ncbi:hypothetical protein NB311A_02642 [Nitrobacter sp. Nb-311A]|nr:hypothetical protein NB311A_02642 [Nitrobacter sp. Nb-311A]
MPLAGGDREFAGDDPAIDHIPRVNRDRVIRILA